MALDGSKAIGMPAFEPVESGKAAESVKAAVRSMELQFHHWGYSIGNRDSKLIREPLHGSPEFLPDTAS